MRKKLLVVDNAPDLLANMARRLRLAGYHVYTASSGADGLRRAQRLAPDLIILDVMLSDINGYSVCEELRQHATTAAIPVLMLTSLAGELPRYAGIEAGAIEVLRKPFAWTELLEHARLALSAGASLTDG
jgi:DNA-binding response OmpR family regulator